MDRYALLCGSAPKGFRQEAFVKKYDLLTRGKNACVPEHVIEFPYGVNELFLEGVLNSVFEEVADNDGEVLLYFCTRIEEDLHAQLSGSCVANAGVFRLGEDEIRKDVVAYYEEGLVYQG